MKARVAPSNNQLTKQQAALKATVARLSDAQLLAPPSSREMVAIRNLAKVIQLHEPAFREFVRRKRLAENAAGVKEGR